MNATELSDFWGLLVRRINSALRDSRDDNVRFLWVDDIVAPVSPLLGGEAAAITTAFVSEDSGTSFIQYRACLFLSEAAVAAYGERDWSRLLPAQNSTDWIVISRADKELTIVL